MRYQAPMRGIGDVKRIDSLFAAARIADRTAGRSSQTVSLGKRETLNPAAIRSDSRSASCSRCARWIAPSSSMARRCSSQQKSTTSGLKGVVGGTSDHRDGDYEAPAIGSPRPMPAAHANLGPQEGCRDVWADCSSWPQCRRTDWLSKSGPCPFRAAVARPGPSLSALGRVPSGWRLG